ncbi:MAG TPA: lipopolysaccharide assembly protein LapA domain-containing protein [Desulfobaccales bacterium]|nr:lipopolysaccharide assembly protein LapA domain-containing protein [Desulfobaccales bacterium]
MSKFKAVLLIILTIVIADFAFENAELAPAIKLFKFQLGELPSFLLIYLSLAVGMVIGWVAHGLRIRRKRREAQAAQAASAQQQQESQAGQEARQAQEENQRQQEL